MLIQNFWKKRIMVIGVMVFVLTLFGLNVNTLSLQGSLGVTNVQASSQEEKISTVFTVDLPVAQVEILNYAFDRSIKEMKFELKVTWLDGSSEVKKLTIAPASAAPLDQGGRATLRDAGNQLLCEVFVGWDVKNPKAFELTERTSTDVMTIQYSSESGMIKERYTINGAYKEFVYPLVSEEEFNKDINLYQSIKKNGNLSKLALSNTASQLLEEIAEFDGFYSRYQDNSLHNNPDGEMLAYLLTHPDFLQWAKNQLYPGGESPAPISESAYDVICAGSGLVSFFKCLFGGGWANFICISATGVSIACAISTLVLAL